MAASLAPGQDHGGARSVRAHVLAAFAVCLAVIAFQTFHPDFRRPVADAVQYAKFASALIEDGVFAGAPGAPPQMVAAPRYPASVAAVASLDPDLAPTLTCVIDIQATCDLSGLTGLFMVQAGIAALTALFVFLAGWRLTGSPATAWLALLIGLASKVFSEYASQILTEILAFFFLHLFGWLLVRLLTSEGRTRTICVLAGLALGAATLVRPAYLYLAYFMVPALFALLLLIARRPPRAAVLCCGLLIAGTAAALTPWVLRNYLTFDVAAISSGYGDRILAERLAYNLMTSREWAISFIYWLPDFGDSAAAWLFDRADYIRLSFDDPSSFYMMGRGSFFTDLRSEAHSQAPTDPAGYLLKTYVWDDLATHVSVTIALAWRGMWAGRYVGLFGFLLLPACLYLMYRAGRLGPFLAYCLPGFFMLGLYAFVSVNVVRYNDPLIAVFALVIAIVLVRTGGWLRTRARPSA